MYNYLIASFIQGIECLHYFNHLVKSKHTNVNDAMTKLLHGLKDHGYPSPFKISIHFGMYSRLFRWMFTIWDIDYWEKEICTPKSKLHVVDKRD